MKQRGRPRKHRPEGLIPLRKCHDCGRPTSDYRCELCQARWKKRQEEAYADVYTINLPGGSNGL